MEFLRQSEDYTMKGIFSKPVMEIKFSAPGFVNKNNTRHTFL